MKAKVTLIERKMDLKLLSEYGISWKEKSQILADKEIE